jgi:hypothetical protein
MSDDFFNLIVMMTLLFLGAGVFTGVVIFVAALLAFKN